MSASRHELDPEQHIPHGSISTLDEITDEPSSISTKGVGILPGAMFRYFQNDPALKEFAEKHPDVSTQATVPADVDTLTAVSTDMPVPDFDDTVWISHQNFHLRYE